MNLQFTRQKCLLANLNIRAEMHGEEHESAADLKLECDLPNDVLIEFHPALRTLLYHYDESREADLVDQGRRGDKDYAPHVRMKSLGSPLKWEEELVAAVTIHYGIGGKSDMALESCKVNAWQIEPREGGTISLTFRVQAHPSEKEFGRLATMVQSEIEISIEPAGD